MEPAGKICLCIACNATSIHSIKRWRAAFMIKGNLSLLQNLVQQQVIARNYYICI
jgi:hypothetical protein